MQAKGAYVDTREEDRERDFDALQNSETVSHLSLMH